MAGPPTHQLSAALQRDCAHNQGWGCFLTLLYEVLINGELIGASNGLLQKNTGKTTGGYSFSLQTRDYDDGRIVGCAASPWSNDMTSLTTELYSILSTVICTYIVWIQHRHRYLGIKNFPAVTIYSGNKEAINKSNEEVQ